MSGMLLQVKPCSGFLMDRKLTKIRRISTVKNIMDDSALHGRPYAAPYLAVNQGGQGVNARALCEVGDDKVI